MYTIREVAEILKITPQAVYKKLNQVDNLLQTELKHVERNGKQVKVITEKGLDILKKKLEQPSLTTDDNELVTLLNETIDLLKAQLQIKDQQIKELSELNHRNQDLLLVQQQLNLKNLQALPPSPWDKFKKFFRGSNNTTEFVNTDNTEVRK